MTNGERIRKERKRRGWSQRELAEATGYTRTLVCKVESDKTANHRTIARLLEAVRNGK